MTAATNVSRWSGLCYVCAYVCVVWCCVRCCCRVCCVLSLCVQCSVVWCGVLCEAVRPRPRTLLLGRLAALDALGVVELGEVAGAEHAAVLAEEVVLQLRLAPVALEVVHLRGVC